jgi:hypothetical protein
MEEIKLCRKTAGDTYILAHDPVQAYNLFEAQKVGRLLDELDYAWYEDPIRTVDLDGLVELNRTLDLPLHIGEFLFSVSEFAEYIQKGALNVARLIADNVGGISGSMRVGLLADAFGLECTPHNWGNVLDLAVHQHIEVALPNARYRIGLPMPDEMACLLPFEPRQCNWELVPHVLERRTAILRPKLDKALHMKRGLRVSARWWWTAAGFSGATRVIPLVSRPAPRPSPLPCPRRTR